MSKTFSVMIALSLLAGCSNFVDLDGASSPRTSDGGPVVPELGEPAVDPVEIAPPCDSPWISVGARNNNRQIAPRLAINPDNGRFFVSWQAPRNTRERLAVVDKGPVHWSIFTSGGATLFEGDENAPATTVQTSVVPYKDGGFRLATSSKDDGRYSLFDTSVGTDGASELRTVFNHDDAREDLMITGHTAQRLTNGAVAVLWHQVDHDESHPLSCQGDGSSCVRLMGGSDTEDPHVIDVAQFDGAQEQCGASALGVDLEGGLAVWSDCAAGTLQWAGFNNTFGARGGMRGSMAIEDPGASDPSTVFFKGQHRLLFVENGASTARLRFATLKDDGSATAMTLAGPFESRPLSPTLFEWRGTLAAVWIDALDQGVVLFSHLGNEGWTDPMPLTDAAPRCFSRAALAVDTLPNGDAVLVGSWDDTCRAMGDETPVERLFFRILTNDCGF